MKICIVELIQKGGMVHYTSQLCNSLGKLNNMQVYLIIPEGTDKNLFDENIKIFTVPVIGRHPYRLDLLLKFILKINPDIVHITISHPLIIPILPFLKLMKYPIVLTVHDLTPHPGENFQLLSNISLSVTTKYANFLLVHGEKLKSELCKRAPETNISVIPHGDYSFFNNYSRKEISEENDTILFFGRILEYKGLEYLIKAEPLISKVIPNIKIIIAGEGDFSKYDNLIENKNNFEIYNNYIPDEKVAELFQRSSLVVLPYIEASQSGIIPIAYAFRKPVIVTDVGSLKEVVYNEVTGFIIQPKNLTALVDSILKLLKDPILRKNMGCNAYRLMNEKMSWNLVAMESVNVYNLVKKNITNASSS